MTTDLQLPNLTEETAVYMYSMGILEYVINIILNRIFLQKYDENVKNTYYFYPKGELIDGIITFYDINDDSITYRYSYNTGSFIDSISDLSKIEINNGHADFTIGDSMVDKIEYYFETKSMPAFAIDFPVIVPIIIFPKEISIIHTNNTGFLANVLGTYEKPDENTIKFYQTNSEYNKLTSLFELSYQGPIVSSTGESYPYAIEEPLKGVEDPDNEVKAEFHKQTRKLIISINYPAGTSADTMFTIYGINLLVGSSFGIYNKLIYNQVEITAGTFIILSIDISDEPEILNILNGTDVQIGYDYIMYWDDDPGPEWPTPPTP